MGDASLPPRSDLQKFFCILENLQDLGHSLGDMAAGEGGAGNVVNVDAVVH